ncbi:hypothetical protein F5Y00DRAFT_271523 [Daldinia vernicosa]|uniref:uncharacterized protein n=1 Tax=Daldinia vernicosa TaxID=114800 RepID=UPI0020082D23|nr:uncharacterized protein F5Y00DRAFT_271523 [Daldinia vernicosa]KAI0846860.1 hypothetical protein F5Y00DRAFT_271523 [Daldinia vernicosa]
MPPRKAGTKASGNPSAKAGGSAPKGRLDRRPCVLWAPQTKAFCGGGSMLDDLEGHYKSWFVWNAIQESPPYVGFTIHFPRRVDGVYQYYARGADRPSDVHNIFFGAHPGKVELTFAEIAPDSDALPEQLRGKVDQPWLSITMTLHDDAELICEGWPWPFEGRDQAADAAFHRHGRVDGAPITLSQMQQLRTWSFLMKAAGNQRYISAARDSVVGFEFSYPFGNQFHWDMKRYLQTIPNFRAEKQLKKVYVHASLNNALTCFTQSVVQDAFPLLQDANQICGMEVQAGFMIPQNPSFSYEAGGDTESEVIEEYEVVAELTPEILAFRDALRILTKPGCPLKIFFQPPQFIDGEVIENENFWEGTIRGLDTNGFLRFRACRPRDPESPQYRTHEQAIKVVEKSKISDQNDRVN